MATPVLSTVSGTNEGTNGASTVTQASYVVPSGTSALIAYVHARITSGAEWTGVVFNSSETFSQITAFTHNTGRVGIYYLANPTATTANVVAIWNGTTDDHRLAVQRVDLLDTAGTPYGTPAGATNTMTVAVSSVSDDMVVDAALHAQSQGAATEGTNQVTQYLNSTMGGTVFYAHSSFETAAGVSTTMDRTGPGSGTRVIVGVALKGIAAGATDNIQPSKLVGSSRLLTGKLGG